MKDITLLLAFTGGMISFFSPCIFPLLPAYTAHLTGGTIKDGRVNAGKNVIVIRSVAFIAGFSIIFVAMGASASALGQFFAEYRIVIEKLSGILVVIFGLQMAGYLKLSFLMMERKITYKTQKTNRKNAITSFIMGIAFGAGWTPCVGLALSSILLMASSSDTVYKGMFMLFVYSLGLGVPFLVLSLAVGYSLKVTKRINKWIPRISLASGWILMFMGILLFTGQMQKITSWLTYITTS
ncbi:cytochrome c biogenesis protein CcdA [Fictibacillus sp. NE201]|uniref:Cytochrome c biogenesis protein CcdA n=2 Tax=Fictibacillus fluitans TaxID=3058422 RepID=A0ABT8HRH6_9BACL|nr:cytochrome c biogenesis protein CcdA [Fictibacillus sp. NE201]MDN4523339.1 cytochrome c biogenesis protein CcdA [Fictibacillus sp. NE201]